MDNIDQINNSAAEISVQLSENAAKRISVLMDQEGEGDGMVRITVSGGGCAGFQYGFSFDRILNNDDVIIRRDDAKVVIDEISLNYLQGSVIDYVEDLIGAAFTVKNPNATSSCSCGSSFAI